MNNLAKIYSEIHNVLEKKQVLGVVSLDLEKAYDTTWRYRTTEKLKNILSNGHMLTFIKNFLSKRTFRVKISGTLSSLFIQENVIHQGSNISATLFLITINDIASTIKILEK